MFVCALATIVSADAFKAHTTPRRWRSGARRFQTCPPPFFPYYDPLLSVRHRRISSPKRPHLFVSIHHAPLLLPGDLLHHAHASYTGSAAISRAPAAARLPKRRTEATEERLHRDLISSIRLYALLRRRTMPAKPHEGETL